MKNTVFALLATSAALAIGSSAGATTITFDDIDASSYPAVENGYEGLDWSNFYVVGAAAIEDLYGPSGYVNGTVSQPNFVANGSSDTASISGTAFTLNSGNFTGAWNDGLTVSATGYVAGVATYSASFVVDTSGPTLHSFNWTDLSSVDFVGSGGINHGYNGYGTHIVFDNIVVNEAIGSAVPEPATWAMMIGGIGIAGGALRRRRASVRTTVRFA